MDKNKYEVKAEINVILTKEDIDDIMCSALEGGICYWASKAKVVEEKRCGDWGHEQIARGGALILHDAESSDKWELNLEKFLNGVKLWLQYGALQCDGTLDTGEIDADMADMIIQYAIFGEVVFG